MAWAETSMKVGHSLRLALAAVVLSSVALASPALATVPSGGSGTIVFAEAPGANPNFIFPYLGCAYSSVNNINQFQMLMYRPLYWFGLGASTAFVPSLSLANRPTFSHGDRTVTITMKGWRFADGQVVNARSVMFFLNMYKADPTAYCGYNAGYGIPDQVKSASGHADTVRINFTTSVNPN
ncbi:MAG TPA: ABC transporter substrate-binding protein, partial [Acidimicrobiales bacterium]